MTAANFQTANLLSEQQIQERQNPTIPNRAGLFEGIGAALSINDPISSIARVLEQYSVPEDPDFILTDDMLTELARDLPTNAIPMFANATSLQQAQIIRLQQLDLMRSKQRLASMGATGAVLNIGAAMLSPGNLGFDAFAVATTGPAAITTKLTRLQRGIRGGLAVGAAEAGIVGTLAQTDPDVGLRDVLFSAAGGVALGGLITSALPIRTRGVDEEMAAAADRFGQALGRLQKSILLKDIEESGAELTEEGRRAFFANLSPEGRRKVVDDHLDGLDLDDETLAGLKALDPEDILPDIIRNDGLAPPDEILQLRIRDLDYTGVPAPERVRDTGVGLADVATRKARVDMAATLKESPIPEVRRAGQIMADDPIPTFDRQGNVVPTTDAASRVVVRQHSTEMARFARTAEKSYLQWASRNGGVSRINSNAKRGEFFELVAKATRRAPGEFTNDPDINRMANHIRERYRAILKLLKDSGAPGFEDVPENLLYTPRFYRLKSITDAIATHGPEPINRFFATAILRGSDNLTLDQANILARATIRHIIDGQWQSELLKGRLFDGSQTAALRRALEEELGTDQTDLIERILFKITDDEPANPRARRRMSIDETYRDERLGLSFEDLLENNAEILFNSYSRQAYGAVVIRRVIDAFEGTFEDAAGNIVPKKLNTFDEVISEITKAAQRLGGSKRDARRFQGDVLKLQTLARHIQGMRLHGPLQDSPTLDAIARNLRAYQFLRVMGQVGIAQFPEMANALGELGMGTMMRAMPELKQMRKLAQDGRMPSDLLNEIELMNAAGTDGLRGLAFNRIDDASGTFDTLVQNNGLLDRGARAVAKASGLEDVNRFLQLMASVGAVQKWMDIATRGSLPSARRLGSMGLNEGMAKRIVDQISNPNIVKSEMGTFGRSVKRLNLEKWDDRQAMAAFVTAIDKFSRRVVQVNDIGQMSRWMTKPWARIALQFRSFHIGAWPVQFLHGVSMRDMDVFRAWSMSSLFAGMAYIGQTYANSIGRGDREEFLEERLSLRRIGAASFARSSYASLIPSAIDTTAGLFKFPAPFSFIRTTDLVSGGFTQNPTLDFGNKAASTIGNIAQAAIDPDRDFTQSDFQQAKSLFPAQNVFVISNILNAIGSNLPER